MPKKQRNHAASAETMRRLTPSRVDVAMPDAQPGSACRKAEAERGSGSKRKSTSEGALHFARLRKLVGGRRNRPSQAIAGLTIAALS